MSVWSYVFSSSLPSKTEVFSFRFRFPFPSMLWNLTTMLVQICKATIRCCQQLLHKFTFIWCGFEKNFLKNGSIDKHYLNWTFTILWKIKQNTRFGGHIPRFSPSLQGFVRLDMFMFKSLSCLSTQLRWFGVTTT